MPELKIPLHKVVCEEITEGFVKQSVTRARLVSDSIYFDLSTSGIGHLMLDRKRNTLANAPPYFNETDIAADFEGCYRVCPRGALVDKFSNDAAGGDDLIERRHTNRLFCQGSTLPLSCAKKFGLCFPVLFPSGCVAKQHYEFVKLRGAIAVP